MRTAIACGIEPEVAIASATINPAKSIGIYNEVGSLSIGKKADILLLDKEFQLIKVISQNNYKKRKNTLVREEYFSTSCVFFVKSEVECSKLTKFFYKELDNIVKDGSGYAYNP